MACRDLAERVGARPRHARRSGLDGSFVNDRGQAPGNRLPTRPRTPPTAASRLMDPFLWQNGVMHDLGTLGGTFGYTNWMNSRGEVVGSSDLPGDAAAHPFLWNGHRLVDLGTLGGDNGVSYGSTTPDRWWEAQTCPAARPITGSSGTTASCRTCRQPAATRAATRTRSTTLGRRWEPTLTAKATTSTPCSGRPAPPSISTASSAQLHYTSSSLLHQPSQTNRVHRHAAKRRLARGASHPCRAMARDQWARASHTHALAARARDSARTYGVGDPRDLFDTVSERVAQLSSPWVP